MRRGAGCRMWRPRGVTLISLLVGLAISMLVILAALSLFQRMVKTTVNARQDAQSNAQRNASFVSAGLILQSAGFGIADAVWGTHGMVLKDLAWDAEHQRLTGQNSADGQGNAVVWSDNITGASQCRVLWAPAQGGGLRLLGPVACANVTAWSSLAWGTPRSLDRVPQGAITLAQSTATCAPFGIGPATEQVRLTFSATSSSGQVLHTSICLANMRAS